MVRCKQNNPKKNIKQKTIRKIITRSQTKRLKEHNNDIISMPTLRFPNTIKADVKTGINMNKKERLYEGGKIARSIQVAQSTDFVLSTEHINNSRIRSSINTSNEIRRYQNSNGLSIKKIALQRIIREISSNIGEYRFQATAIVILHEAVEAYMVSLFEDINLCTKHRNAVTITSKDIQLASRIRRKKNC